MANPLLENPAKQHATLFLLAWHLTQVRYTDWTEDVVSEGNTYTSEPRVGIRLPRESGGVNEQPAILTWPIDLPPADTLTAQNVHARVSVLVSEVLPGDDTTLATRYFGWVRRSRKGHRGDKNLAALQLNSIKHLLRSPLGIPAMRTCAWRFGDANCQFDAAALRETGTIAAVTDDVVTVDGLTTTATPGYWFRGYLQVGAERINIRRYDTPNIFYLSRRPPSSWATQEVTATPGCDKTVSVCKERWDNLDHFGGLGFKMPPRHPVIELPSVGFQAVSPNLSPLTQIPALSALYDVYQGVRKTVSAGDFTPGGEPSSQENFDPAPTPDVGWGANNLGSTDYRVAYWDDISGANPQKRLQQLTTFVKRPLFVRGSAIVPSAFNLQTPADTGNECGASWDWTTGGGRWAVRGWYQSVGLPPVCSSDYYWSTAYWLGDPTPQFAGALGNLNLVFCTSPTVELAETSMVIPHQYHDNVAGLTFFAVCRNRVYTTTYLSAPLEVLIGTFYENHNSTIFESIGSWILRMGDFTVENGESGSPTQFSGNSVLDIAQGSGPQSPLGINWRVVGLRVEPGVGIITFTSAELTPFDIIDSTAAPNVMAPATGYRFGAGHLECAAMAMYERALSDTEVGTVVQYLKGRYGVHHPPA